MDRRKRRSGGRPRSAPATVQRRPVSRTAAARRRALAARRRRALVRRRRRILLISVLAALLLCVGVAVGIGSLVRQTPQGEAEPREETYTVNEACETYRPTVTKMAKTYGMGDYVDLIMAVMMQESSGGLVDVMQSSEGKFNTKYPQEPNGITDTEYSIECGIQELKDNLEQAGCTGPEDMDKIKIALQAYNFGSGYLGYLKEKGESQWTEENAQAFAKYASKSKKRAQDDPYRETAGLWDYGDQYYPEHVLRYYESEKKKEN